MKEIFRIPNKINIKYILSTKLFKLDKWENLLVPKKRMNNRERWGKG